MVLPLGDVEKTHIVPYATYLLLALNVCLFGVELTQGESFQIAYSATPYEITHNVDLVGPIPVPSADDEDAPRPHPRFANIEQAPGPTPIWLTLFTSLFLHGSPLHLAGNMLFLWIYGDNVEEVLGTFRYGLVYLACGVAGTLLQIAAAPDSTIPTLGASGAIAGIMGAYLIWFPQNRIRVLFFRYITELPAIVVIGLWIIMQLLETVGSLGQMGKAGGVAYLAHVGGALTGIGVALVYRNEAERIRELQARSGWFYGPDSDDE